MSVWLTIPSARQPAEANPVLQKWREQGYKIALFCDSADQLTLRRGVYDRGINPACGYEYPGYAEAVNALVFAVSEEFADAEWFIAAGDDTLPDLNHTADEIAAQCNRYFEVLARLQWAREVESGIVKDTRGPWAFKGLTETLTEDRKATAFKLVTSGWPDGLKATETFGVMQPTGDRFDGGSIDRICGSAWLGREFCRRINQGQGPLWPEYKHMFVDQELQEVALKYGVLWQRRDLIHLHRHFARESDALDSPAVATRVNAGEFKFRDPNPPNVLYGGEKKPRPAHLDQWNTKEHWNEMKAIFEKRKREGFPGSEPL